MNLKQVNDYSYTALIFACDKKLEKVALKMLEFGAEACNLNHVSNAGFRALIISCGLKLTNIALKILNFSPEECNLHQKYNNNNSLSIAKENNLLPVCLKILNHIKK